MHTSGDEWARGQRADKLARRGMHVREDLIGVRVERWKAALPQWHRRGQIVRRRDIGECKNRIIGRHRGAWSCNTRGL